MWRDHHCPWAAMFSWKGEPAVRTAGTRLVCRWNLAPLFLYGSLEWRCWSGPSPHICYYTTVLQFTFQHFVVSVCVVHVCVCFWVNLWFVCLLYVCVWVCMCFSELTFGLCVQCIVCLCVCACVLFWVNLWFVCSVHCVFVCVCMCVCFSGLTFGLCVQCIVCLCVCAFLG